VEDAAEGDALPRADACDSVADLHAPLAARPVHRPLAVRKHDRLALRERHHLDASLLARPLLEQQELAPAEVALRVAQQERDLEWEGDRSVEVLVQTVVATGRVAQQ
jgi:hypothetical protein